MITLTGKVTVRGFGRRSRGSSSVCMLDVKRLETYYRRILGYPYDRKDDRRGFNSGAARTKSTVDGL
jgi:hypothetical protein